MTEEPKSPWAPPEGPAGPPPAWDQQPGTTAPPPAWQQPPPGWSQPPPQGPPTGGPVGQLPPYPAPAPRRRGPALVGIAVGAVLALAAGAFAVTSMGNDAASTPEAAVEALFGALADEDVLGILATVAPGERQVYQPFIEDMVGELQRLDVLAGDLDLAAIEGIDIEVDGLELRSSALGEGVSLVSITGGTITSTLRPAEVPIGSFVRNLMEDSDVDMEEVSKTEPLVPDEPFDIVVIDDGGWHVSLHYSIAELARKESGLPAPAFGQGVAPEGADSPTAAVRALLEAAVDLDVRGMIALTPPGEMSVLHDYAPLFLDEAEAAIGEFRAETDFDISIDGLEADEVIDDDVAKVTITDFAVSGSVEGEAFEAAYEGECFSGSYAGEVEEICTDELEEQGMGTAFTRELVDAQLGVMTVERDGKWYVSPLRSTFEVLLAVVGAVDRSDLEDPEQFFMDAFGFPFLGSPFGTGFDESFGSVEGELGWETEEPFGDPYAECDAIYDELPADATDEELAEASRAYDECLSRSGNTGEESGESFPGEECFAIYDELGVDATEEDYAAADDAYEACYEAATGG